MGGSVSNVTIRYSESFHVEAGKTYTVLMTDEDPDADYKLSFLNLTTGVSYRENGAVRMLGIKSEPHGLIAPEADADLCVYIAHNDYILYEHHLVACLRGRRRLIPRRRCLQLQTLETAGL
jgi:hypothetical protein